MKYSDYPAAKPSQAFVKLGETLVKLPKPKWTIDCGGKSIECNFSVTKMNGHTHIHFHSEVSWSEPIMLTVWRKNDAVYDVTLSWSSGGLGDGVSPLEASTAYASMWKVANECLQRIAAGRSAE